MTFVFSLEFEKGSLLKLKTLSKLTAILMILFLLTEAPIAMAKSLSELKQQQNQAEQKAENLNSFINQKSSEIRGVEVKQDKLLAQIQTIDEKISETNEQIRAVAREIEITTQEIIALQESIDFLITKIEQRDALLQERARAIQASGQVSYIDVLLGANSFVDFIDRFSAINTLMEADRQIMREQKEDKEKLEEQKYQIETKRKQLQANKDSLVRLKESLSAQKIEKNKVVAELERQQEKLRSQKQLLQEQYSEAVKIEKSLEQQIIAEQNRIAELARQAEQRRKQQAAANTSSSGISNESLPEVTDGNFMKPTNGILTSGYGWRNLGYGAEFHYGIDLANVSGTPIVASADGIVAYAAPLDSYGNVIIITHSINGDIYTTVYAHLSSFSVSKGDTVAKGQKIGGMGNTGRSFGSHLHFEIHTGTWRNQKAGNQNPLNYITL